MEEAKLVLESLKEVFKRLKKPMVEEPLMTLKIAMKENLTYYDASYVSATLKNNLTLVTDDDKLYEASK